MMDTHKVVKRLEKAGFTPEQAETVTDVMAEERTIGLASLATKDELKSEILALRSDLKADMTVLRSELKSHMATLRGEFKTDMAELRGDVKAEIAGVCQQIRIAQIENLKWMFGMLVAFASIIVALIKLLPGH
jgi:hypothetical protein